MSVIATKLSMPVKQEVKEVLPSTSSPEVKTEEIKPTLPLKVEFSLDGKAMTYAELGDIVKKMGSYDDGYGAPKDKTPPPASSEEKPYEVPGVHVEEKDKGDGSEKPADNKVEGNYDDKYVPPMAEDHQEPDGDECDDEEMTCSACGSKYKAKKAEEEEEKKAEEIMPKKEEFALNFGMAGQVFKPTKEELMASKKTHVDKNALFGIQKKKSDTVGSQMTAWAIGETLRLTPTKKS